jgi:hypothetical protein
VVLNSETKNPRKKWYPIPNTYEYSIVATSILSIIFIVLPYGSHKVQYMLKSTKSFLFITG